MNGSQAERIAYLSLGSNIAPVENLREAIRRLRAVAGVRVLALSMCWETAAVTDAAVTIGHDPKDSPKTAAPNFYNLGARVATPLEREALKDDVLRPLEAALGRVRSADKYAPRTIDLDITVHDGQVVDTEIWRRLYLALIFAELLPELRNPATGETPAQAAARLAAGQVAIRHPEVVMDINKLIP